MSMPFECDLCQFRNVAQRDVEWDNPKDVCTLMYVRGASLDAMWSRRPNTVEGNIRKMRLDVGKARDKMTIGPLFPKMGNPRMEDRVGMGIALVSLEASLRKGKYAPTLQHETIRKTVTWANHAHKACTGGAGGSIFTSDNKKMYLSDGPGESRWFSAFLLGLKRRIGVIRKQDEPLSIDQLLVALEIAEEIWMESADFPARRKRIEEVGAFMCIGFCASLRGEEVPLVSILGMLEYWEASLSHEIPHIMVTLRGRFKGEHNLKWHLVPIAVITASRIPTKVWVSRLMHTRVKLEGCREGPLFADKRGRKATLKMYDGDFKGLLEKALERSPKVFPEKTVIDDYQLKRSLRRGSTTEATNKKVPGESIDLMNRWRKRELAQGAEPGLAMRQVYTQTILALESTLRYSQSF